MSGRALSAITAANPGQDSLHGPLQFARHFDNSLFTEGLVYIEAGRAEAAHTADTGRLWHTAQDFYSYSHYVALWHSQFAPGHVPAVEAVDGLDPVLLCHPELRSGRLCLPWDCLAVAPILKPLAKRLVPRDGHAWMNLDAPDGDPLFACSLEAATQRTGAGSGRTLAASGPASGPAAARAFLDQ